MKKAIRLKISHRFLWKQTNQNMHASQFKQISNVHTYHKSMKLTIFFFKIVEQSSMQLREKHHRHLKASLRLDLDSLTLTNLKPKTETKNFCRTDFLNFLIFFWVFFL